MPTFSSQPDGANGVDATLGTYPNTSTNMGNATNLVIGETNTDTDGNLLNFLIKWDLSSIPAAAIVKSATVYLTQLSQTSSVTRTMY